MTDDEIIEMSSKAGFNGLFSLIVFAKMVAEREREECAKIADEWMLAYPHPSKTIVETIRTRGQE
jgi:hypothetical protein